MIIPLDVKCTICPKTFCCAKCRRKHESTLHAAEIAVRDKCPICYGRPYILEKIVGDNDLFEHLVGKHLPLACNKCSKIFTNRSDLTPATKCDCQPKAQKIVGAVPTSDENKENAADNDCSRYAANKLKVTFNDEHSEILTPLSKWNLKWRRKSTEFHTNVSSIKRTSSLLSSLNKTTASQSDHQPCSAGPKVKKLARSTSTPMQQMILVQKSVTFDSILAVSSVSSCQMSSIAYSVGSESESGGSAASSTSSPEKVAKIVVPKSRPRVPIGVTPLRLQLMSKSVQRAMAAHHGKYEQYHKASIQRKMMFDSTSSSGNGTHGSPLDLRTTPVMRRTQSESIIREHEMSALVAGDIDSSLAIPFDESPALVVPAKTVSFAAHKCRRSSDLVRHMTLLPESDQSGVAASSQPSIESEIYVTCEDFEASSTSQLQKTASLEVLYVTPKPVGGFMKKAISFATPDQMSVQADHEDAHDLWYTPTQDSWLRSRSCSTLVNRSGEPEPSPTPTLASSCDDDTSSDDVFYANTNDADPPIKPTGRLWHIMTSVFRLASGGGSLPNIQNDGGGKKFTTRDQPTKTIAQRAASFAGFFRGPSTGDSAEESSPAKRKRTASHSGQQQQLMNVGSSPKAKRYKGRIRGRQPISRMRDSMC